MLVVEESALSALVLPIGRTGCCFPTFCSSTINVGVPALLCIIYGPVLMHALSPFKLDLGSFFFGFREMLL